MSDFKDEHTGKGGSYVVGADGKRVLQERINVAPAAQATQAATPAAASTKVKGASNAKSN